MVSLIVELARGEAEFRAALWWEAGALGIQEEDMPAGKVRLRGFFEHPPPDFEGRVEYVEDVDWEQRSREAWPAFPVGERLFVAVDWDTISTPDGRHRLIIHPGMAFGSGDHPATRLCMEALEQHMLPGESVLDVGCGSGILLEAARLLGAGFAFGCDIDPEAVIIAARQYHFPLFVGSARAVATRSASFVVANINAQTHFLLATDYGRITTRLLAISGFGAGEAPDLVKAITSSGFTLMGRSSREEQRRDGMKPETWQCLIFRKDVRS